MSATEEEELQVLYDNLRQIRLLNNVVLSCAAFVAYDILTNLDREIPLIWRYYHDVDNDEYTSWHRRARHILVQILFVFGRYYALLYLVLLFIVNSHQGLSVSFCKAYLYYFIFGGELPYTTLVNIILVIRLNAMYRIIHGTQGLRKYQVFLSCVAIAEFVAEFIVAAVMVTWMVQRVVEPPAGVPWPGCSLSESPNTALTLPAWVTAILVATIFLGLTLRLLYSSMKLKFGHFGDFTVSNIKEKIRNIQPITLTLVRDSVLIYFPMLGILVASVPIMVVYESAVIATVTLPIIPAVYSFSVSSARSCLFHESIIGRCPGLATDNSHPRRFLSIIPLREKSRDWVDQIYIPAVGGIAGGDAQVCSMKRSKPAEGSCPSNSQRLFLAS